jgi:hydroxymethylpyrimidine/phosphomethylpyrimidine kinase
MYIRLPEATALIPNSQRYKTLTEEEIAAEEKRAEYIKQQAETIHSYASCRGHMNKYDSLITTRRAERY